MRQNGLVQKAAVLIAVGVDVAGKRTVLGVSVALSEHEVHWRTFLQSLVARGLCGVQLVTSDAHEGLKAARLAVFGGVPWQRCQFHLPPNKALAKRFGVCAQAGHEAAGHEAAGGGRHPGGLQRPGQSRGRCAAEADGAEVRADGSEACRLARRKSARRLDGACVSRSAPPLAANHQRGGKVEPRNKASYAGGEYFPKRSVLPTARECAADGDQRRLAGGESLFNIQTITKQ